MPEIKNTFLKGKMNKDLDERLIPEGEYRDALNIEVATSEGSNVGVVKNILGNHRLEDKVPEGFTCVGSISDEKTNKLYWFITGYGKDAILEYDLDRKETSFVFVDLYAGTSKSVLNFSGKIITGISIIDDLLLWTDNINNPKKININECKKGTVDFNTHTQLIFDNGSFNGLTIDIITDNTVSPFVILEDGERAWYEGKQLDALLGVDAIAPGFSSGEHVVKHYRDGDYLGKKNIVVFNDPLTPLGTYFHAVDDFTSLIVDDKAWEKGDIIFGDDVSIDIEERHITVIKPKPLSALAVKINHTEDKDSVATIPNLFETKLPRFSYRYKYRDGEFSPFAPFTNPVFNAKYPKDTSVSVDSNVFFNKDNAYTAEEPFNRAMVNSIHSVELTNFITNQTPEDVVEIDILYKQEESPIIYSIASIKHSDKQWHTASNHEGLGIKIGLGKSQEPLSGTYEARGSITKGKYVVSTENIYAALPANQLLRPWDNVPRRALAQEITGNRVVYGNYTQGYNIDNDVEISVSYEDRKAQLINFETQGLPHVKSQRNYQVGIIYSDKYGRETPVFTSPEGAVNIPWQDNSGILNASRSLQLNASVTNNFPEWVDSFKFFIKETSNPYYNLTMDRAWVTKSTYELDNEKDNIWISFPSSDRNKITEEDHIILKKKIGTAEEQVPTENKFKVIDISNNAPDAIKFQLVNYGYVSQQSSDEATNSLSIELMPNKDRRIDKEIDTIEIDSSKWKAIINSGTGILGQVPLEEKDDDGNDGAIRTKDLYVSWRRLTSGNKSVSKKYKITGGQKVGSLYILKLAKPITKTDADIAHHDGDSSIETLTQDSNGTPALHPDLIVQIEKREAKDDQNFSGKFFVKISKNQVANIIQSGNINNVVDEYQVSSKTSSWYWQDDIGITAIADGSTPSDYGLMNFFGQEAVHSGADSIHHINNNDGVGDVDANSDELRVTDYHTAWSGIQAKFGSTFFIDSMHMAAGQSEASNNAKYCCITWSGCTEGENTSAETSSWSYPPLKTWLTDFKNKSGLKKRLRTGSVWFNGNLISESLLAPTNSTWRNKRVDGWVGPLQKVKRDTPVDIIAVNNNHINGLEGIVTTNSYHATGPRRWFSGITTGATEHGVGNDTKTYSSQGEVGRHFMHLSFFAPGKDLHDGNFEGFNPDTDQSLYGEKSWAAQLQGIWGGGVFTGGSRNKKFGKTDNHVHLPMEGNHDDNGNYRTLAPGPGVGHGYDYRYRELHERQWDPTFNPKGDVGNKIRDFIRNLFPGSQFRFNKVKSTNVTDVVNGAVSNSVNVVLDTSYVTTGIKVGDIVDGVGVTVGTTVASVNADHGSGASVNNITLSAAMTIADDEVLTFSSPGETDDEIYTIKKVVVKKLYNHTSWRKPYNRYIDGKGYIHDATQHIDYHSVEQTALSWLETVNSSGLDDNTNGERTDFINKIVQFGKAHNRRICYIIELDKNPTNDPDFDPLTKADIMSADLDSNNFCDIEFLDPVESVLLSDLSKFPAIWEIDPKKQDVDLDIYYEAGGSIPTKINSNTNELFAPTGCKVEILNSSITSSSILQSWSGSTAILHPGFPKFDVDDLGVSTEIDYSNLSFKFIREDGSYTIAEVKEYTPDGVAREFETEIEFKENIGENVVAGLSWYNCFSFGNGIESNRIRDSFNEIFITNGVKASTTTQEAYQEENKSNGLIYSGIYNSNSSINELNQFLTAEKITKDLNPTFGSIQKLFQRRISLIAFCEDKVVSITANKDTIFNADGNPQLVASDKVLGDANPFAGDYGISTNPESFAKESFRTYFTDKQRGAVLRLSRDGLTPISKAGMHNWFRDNLREYNSLIGTYDSYKEDYNLTLSNNSFSQNLLQDSYIETGGDPIFVDPTNRIVDGGVNNGTPFEYLYNTYNVLDITDPNNVFNWNSFVAESYALTSSTQITHHAAITAGSLQAFVSQIGFGGVAFQEAAYSTSLETSGGASYAGQVFNVDFSNTSALNNITPNGTGSVFNQGVQNNINANDYNDVMFVDGNVYMDDDPSNNVGGKNVAQADPNIHCTIHRYQGAQAQDGSNAQWGDCYTGGGGDYWAACWTARRSNTLSWYKHFCQGITIMGNHFGGGLYQTFIPYGSILFDRAYHDAYVEFTPNGQAYTHVDPNITDPQGEGELNTTYINDAGHTTAPTDVYHNSFYNGDELHIEMKIFCTTTRAHVYNSGQVNTPTQSAQAHGINWIKPQIQIYDGNTLVSNDKIQDVSSFSTAIGDASETPYNTIHSPAFTENDGMSSGAEFKEAFGYQLSNTVDFPATDEGNYPYDLNSDPSTQGDINSQYYPLCSHTGNPYPGNLVISCSFKFQSDDPNNNDISGQILEEKVIENLKIRFTNTMPPLPVTTGTNVQNANNKPLNNAFPHMTRPQFGIVAVNIKKGYGVTAPGIEEVDSTITQHEVLAVPPVDIPAWTEITHNYFTLPVQTWNITDDSSPISGNTTSIHAEDVTVYGDNYPAIATVGYQQNADISLAPDVQINYVVPSGFDLSTGVENPPAVIGQASASVGTSYNRNTDGDTYSPAQVLHNNDYIYIENVSGGISTIAHSLTVEPLVVGDWYLIDVEWDQLHNPNAGITDGEISAGGLAPDYLNGVEGESCGDENWIGVYGLADFSAAGFGGHPHVKLLPVTRTEYGTQETVLRTIFQVDPTSLKGSGTTPLDSLNLFIHDITGGIKIKKIITKKLSATASPGLPADWASAAPAQSSPAHSFSNNQMYFKNNSLCWQLPANVDGIDLYHSWSQDLTNLNSLHQGPWDLNFTVEANPVTNNFSGSLGGVVAVSNTGVFRGVAFSEIEDVGNYKISFDLTDNSDGSGWIVYREEFGEMVPYSNQSIITAIASPWDVGNAGNKIQFYQDLGETDAQEYAINNISLTPLSQEFLVGNIGSWSINGFDVTQQNPFVSVDSINNYFVFNNCPIQDDGTQFISISQQIDSPINESDSYRISFNHGITSGEIGVYYYNNNGYGFKITGIDSSTPSSFSQVVVIGEDIWSATQQEVQNGVDYSTYNPDLKSTFVIVARDNGSPIDGFIDNISMVRVYVSVETSDKTITFNESVNGWSSFKSFVPESGVSLSKKYFTFKNGALWQHYVPKFDGSLDYTDNEGFKIKYKSEEANNYNSFYGDSSYSSVKAVFNQQPSFVKLFNTINYEGSQAYVFKPSQSEITINNAEAWSSGGDIQGWECSEIKTDLQTGSVIEFIKKEGKWFNYIKGINNTNNIDTSKFNIQGVGIVQSVQVSNFTPPVDNDGGGIVPGGAGAGGAGAGAGGAGGGGGAGGDTY